MEYTDYYYIFKLIVKWVTVKFDIFFMIKLEIIIIIFFPTFVDVESLVTSVTGKSVPCLFPLYS